MTRTHYSFRDLAGIDDRSVLFQPIVDTATAMPLAYQAIVAEARDCLDRLRGEQAIAQAVQAGIVETGAPLALPMRAAGANPEAALPQLLKAAIVHGLPIDRLVIEIDAREDGDIAAATALADACAARGVAIAFDGFGAGPLGIELLVRHAPLFVRLDPALARDIHASAARRLMVESALRLAQATDTLLVAPEVATSAAVAAFHALGIRHMQGDRIAAPARGRLPRPFAEPVMADALPRRDMRGNLAAYARRDLSAMHRRLLHHGRRAVAPASAAPVPGATAGAA